MGERARKAVEAHLSAIEREGAIIELFLEFPALVVDAMVPDHRGDETEAAAA